MPKPTKKPKKNRAVSINLNDLALYIVQREGLKQSISIAQVKEVLRITLEELATLDLPTLAATLVRVGARSKRRSR